MPKQSVKILFHGPDRKGLLNDIIASTSQTGAVNIEKSFTRVYGNIAFGVLCLTCDPKTLQDLQKQKGAYETSLGVAMTVLPMATPPLHARVDEQHNSDHIRIYSIFEVPDARGLLKEVTEKCRTELNLTIMDHTGFVSDNDRYTMNFVFRYEWSGNSPTSSIIMQELDKLAKKLGGTVRFDTHASLSF